MMSLLFTAILFTDRIVNSIINEALKCINHRWTLKKFGVQTILRYMLTVSQIKPCIHNHALSHIVITKHHHMHIIKTRGHTHAQIIQSKWRTEASRVSFGLDLCFASSPSYHYSLKCRKVQYQTLQDTCRWSSNIVYLRRLCGNTQTDRQTDRQTHTQTDYCITLRLRARVNN